jgi:hypothetical protein
MIAICVVAIGGLLALGRLAPTTLPPVAWGVLSISFLSVLAIAIGLLRRFRD